MTMKKILMIITAILILAASADARKVTGVVLCGEEKLEGVVVTDGKSFTQTKKNGKFAFEIAEDADFVYIITPAGYVADWSAGVPAFYQPAPGNSKFEFQLSKTSDGADYHLLAIGDVQVKNDDHFSIFINEPIDDIAKLCKEFKAPAAGLALGDICWDELQYLSKFKTEMLRTGIPVYPVIGNHDNDRHAVGDHNASAIYRKEMGPENYAFCMGKDVVLVLDNIIYSTKKKYVEGYADHVLSWVKGLLEYIPQDATLYIAQHSPLKGWYTGKMIKNARELLDIIRGYQVVILSGHSHICTNKVIEEDIIEHNVAAICGSWWDTYYCTDGTPRGYKVYTKSGNDLSWYYKSVGKDKDYQVELFMPGQSPIHPNSIVLNVWDYDPQWKAEWYEDGKPMGTLKPVVDVSPNYIREISKVFKGREKEMKKYKYPFPNKHYFAVTPSQYAKNVTIAIEGRFGQQWVYNVDMSDYVDVQAHRGGAGLMPENTIEAMKYCLDLGVNTLEMDCTLTGDGQVIVSHDNYFHHVYTTRPDGSIVQNGDSKEYLYKMTYDQIAKYDVGIKASDKYPEKKCMPAVKPLAADLIAFVENYTKEKGLSPVRYNIEVKCSRKDGEGINWPTYDKVAYEIGKLVTSFNLGDRLVIQCFDAKALNYMQEIFPEIHYSYLISGKNKKDFDEYMKLLKFQPTWLSPHYSLVDEELVSKCREGGLKVVPWTADDPDEMQRLIDLKVDAIITNYPDRLLNLTRGYSEPAPGPIVPRDH